MKGYYTDSAYWGWIGNAYMAFPTEREYREYMAEGGSRCKRQTAT